jgi:hypothetical protein
MRGLLNNGVPPALRARVWSLAVGNVLEITKDQFEIMVATAKATADVTAEENGRVATTREMIATDLHRTVGKIASKGVPSRSRLRQRLMLQRLTLQLILLPAMTATERSRRRCQNLCLLAP